MHSLSLFAGSAPQFSLTKHRRSHQRSVIAVKATAAPVKEEQVDLTVNAPTPSASITTTTTKASTTTSGRVVLESEDELRSTWEQRVWVAGTTVLLATTLSNGISHIDLNCPTDLLSSGSAIFLAYLLSDLGTGVYHWGVDNYGNGKTPFFGSQIAAFQGHHQRPWTITEREFSNNVHKVFRPAAAPAALLLASSYFTPAVWSIWSSTFLFLACMSQQFHAWSHMKKSKLPGVVVQLQDAGMLISLKQHGAHHKPPFEGNYCIVSGWWNPLLDNSGVFRIMEDVVYKVWGVEPRCWNELEDDWKELERN